MHADDLVVGLEAIGRAARGPDRLVLRPRPAGHRDPATDLPRFPGSAGAQEGIADLVGALPVEALLGLISYVLSHSHFPFEAGIASDALSREGLLGRPA